MTLGEKITALRRECGISQARLAELVEVSRQSVSKWETDVAQPQLDKLLPLCRVLGVTTDFLLNESYEVEAHNAQPQPVPGTKYFGPAGFVGEVNKSVMVAMAFRVGRFLGWYFSSQPGRRARIVVGKDTRRSSYTLEYAIASGITASGGDAYMLHVTTMPSVYYVTRQDEFDCGIMITASHTPFYENGIKLISRSGEALDSSVIELLEAYMDGDTDKLKIGGSDLPLAVRENIGSIIDYVAGRNRYVGYLISVAAHSYRSLRIGLDCANGSAWMIARSVFEALGATVTLIGASPDGVNVNRDCGSTHIEALTELVRREHLDMGFAFDGDADRCIAVDERGCVVDGDRILYILGCRLHDSGSLDGNTVVVNLMSNSALKKAFADKGINVVETKVGDRYVYECMEKNGFRLGGEQSGHIILRKYATTGDGILTAIMLTEEVLSRKQTLSGLTAAFVPYPQYMVSIPVPPEFDVATDPVLKECTVQWLEKLGSTGRLLIRRSETEPVIRIMAESPDSALCRSCVDSIAEKLSNRSY